MDSKGTYRTDHGGGSGVATEIYTEHGARFGHTKAGVHGNFIDCGKDGIIDLPDGKDAEAVAKSVKKGDHVEYYLDSKGHAVIYNETQHTVSRRDEHGQYQTKSQDVEHVKGELTRITRDAKDPNHATLVFTDAEGTQRAIGVTDRPGKRIDATMKPGDAIEATYRATSPGHSDLAVKDLTRRVDYSLDHNGNDNLAIHQGRVRPTAINGVTHQHGGGPVLPTAPGVAFNGTVDSVTNHGGIVDIKYKDVMGKPHTISVDSHAAPGDGNPGHSSLGLAALKTLHPGQTFTAEFKPDGNYVLTNHTSRDVATPGKDGLPVVARAPQQQAVTAPTHGGR